MRLTVLLVAVLLLATGCGGGGDTASPPADESADMGAAQEEGTAMGTASISGTISFAGEAPARTPVRMKPECMDERDSAPLAESAVVHESGGLMSVFVHVTAGLTDGYSYPAPSEPAVLDQDGCQYVPHVMGVQTGQTIRIENGDPFQHNIHPVPEVNRGFNESTPNEGDYLEKSFLVPEVMVSVKCDVHSWMQAYIGVQDHPYFSVSDEGGMFSIEGLPAGDYTIDAWHEEFGSQQMQVTVGDGEAATADFFFLG